MKNLTTGALLAGSTILAPFAAYAETEVQFWHAFTGRLGELVAAQVEEFNAGQDEYTVVASHKGNYSETLNAGIAAFRAGEQPQLLMVYDVGCGCRSPGRRSHGSFSR
jgi:sn-glycerol 3-phosphate transport system substrate-binding protein